MGIDVYLRWDDQTEQEQRAQYCGFDTTKGSTGYLRESYGGVRHALYAFVAEGFDEKRVERDAEGDRLGPRIPAAVLRERLPAALEATAERYEGAPYVKEVQASFVAFVELAEQQEARTGKPCRVYVSF